MRTSARHARIKRIRFVVVMLVVNVLPLSLSAGNADAEIEYLLETVGSSDCVFTRNGKDYSSKAAESHLRLKLRKGARYVDTAESFIENLATESSWTGKPYSIQCPGEAQVPSARWLTAALADYRSQAE